MNTGKLFKFFKKGAKAAGKYKGKKGTEAVRWPSGIRIGVFGHANTGKTVFFTVLNEECKISKNLQISVTDAATANEFLTNYRHIWGLGVSTDGGTVVDIRGEKKFPNPTTGEKVLRFNAIIDRKKKVPVVGLDYSGRTVSIATQETSAETIADFMAGCDGMLFFYDSKLLGAEVRSQARVASFINMLERLAPLRSRLPIPVALVITKADVLPGFAGDDQVRLIAPEDEYLTSEDYDLFLERVLTDDKLAANPHWSGSIRNVLVRLKDFLTVVLRRTLDFQIFFISSTGQAPEKIGTDVDRSIYTPPPKMQPIGVKEPMYWLLNSIIRNKRISLMRRLARLVTVASIIWVILFSIPFLMHFKMLYPKPADVEDSIKATHGGSLIEATKNERDRIMGAYDDYEQSKITKWFFSSFRVPAQSIASIYREDNLQKALRDLNENVRVFAATIADQTLWPRMSLTDTVPALDSDHLKLLDVFNKYHQGDTASTLYAKAGHALEYWKLFILGVSHRDDAKTWGDIQTQVKQDSGRYWETWTKEEKRLAQALAAIKVKQEEQKAIAVVTGSLTDVFASINENTNPDYRLDQVLDTLRAIKDKVDAESAKKISAYIRKAGEWQNLREYKYTIESMPAEWHLHIAVAGKDKSPVWTKGDQISLIPGRQEKILWKAGDVIHIAIDSTHASSSDETWGEQPRGKKILRGDFSIFEMEGDVVFDDIGKKVSIRFVPALEQGIPELK